MRLFSLLIVLLLPISSDARIGETSIQFADRYGRPRDTAADKSPNAMFALVEGAIHHTYEYQGWKIRAAFLQLDGPAVRMDFQKLSGAASGIAIRDYELQAIMTANASSGMTWSPMAYDNPDSPNIGLAKSIEGFVAVGQKMWRRSDGAILWSRGIIVRLELPVARQYEAQLKIRKDQKARASVPKF